MKKYLTVSNILACVNFVLALVFLILYIVNIKAEGYFNSATVKSLVVLVVLAMVFDLLVIGSSFLKVEGLVQKVVGVVVKGLKVGAPVMLVIAAMLLIQGRVSGLGYILFSNVDVAKEVATPANLASAGVAITAIAFGLVAGVEGVVAAFFSSEEKEKAEEAPAEAEAK